MKHYKQVAILFLLAFLPLCAKPPYDTPPFPSYITVGVGMYDFHHQTRAFQAQIEYRYSPRFKIPAPLIGFTADHKGMTYLYVGFVFDLFLSDHIVFTPAFALGYYNKGGGKDLGYPLEFRSAVELSYQFKSKARLSLQLYHLSNASISDRNPGEESLLLVYQFPIN